VGILVLVLVLVLERPCGIFESGGELGCMGYFLGIDGGGTKTASAILDEKGLDIGRGLGGPCNIATCDDGMLRRSVSDAVTTALDSAGLSANTKFEAVCAGVAGYTAKKRRAEFTKLLQRIVPADRYRVEPDYVIAYWGATEGEPGIIVSAGTGAVVYGRNEKGETSRSDGLGFILGDSGSGFDIGSRALKDMAWKAEKVGSLDRLSKRIADHIGAEDLEDLVEWTYRPFDPARIASLAEIVIQAADDGLQEAVRIVAGAATNLRIGAQLVNYYLKTKPGLLPIYPLGGLWKGGQSLATYFKIGHPDHGAPGEEVEFRTPKHDAVYGAAFLALQSVDSYE